MGSLALPLLPTEARLRVAALPPVPTEARFRSAVMRIRCLRNRARAKVCFGGDKGQCSNAKACFGFLLNVDRKKGGGLTRSELVSQSDARFPRSFNFSFQLIPLKRPEGWKADEVERMTRGLAKRWSLMDLYPLLLPNCFL